MDNLESKAELEKEIKRHVEKTSGLITNEFEEATEAGVFKYSFSVYRSVEHLESLCSPLVDDEYIENLPESANNVDRMLQNEKYNSVLERSDQKFRHLINMLYRRGVL